MNDLTHLSPAQFDALLIGDTNPAALSLAAKAHIASCPACAAQLASTRSAIGLLGESLTNMAREERFRRNTQTALLNRRPVSTRRSIRGLTASFALAASVAIVAAVVPFNHRSPTPAHHPAVVPATSSTANVQSDEALLNAIDQQLSASVPSALEPLADPVGNQTFITSSTKEN